MINNPRLKYNCRRRFILVAASLFLCAAQFGSASLLSSCRTRSAPTPVMNPSVWMFSSRCAAAPGDLAVYQDQLRQRFLDNDAVQWLTPPISVLDPTLAQYRGELAKDSGGWMFLFHSGHGYSDGSFDRKSMLCLAPVSQTTGQDETLDEVIAKFPSSLGGVTMVVNSCQSAYADVRIAKVPISVISASPYNVTTQALFGEAVIEAISEAARDPNCDGMVTDQELFDATKKILRRQFPLAVSEAFPKLRRQATSHIPLPINLPYRAACAPVLKAINQLAEQKGADWLELARALRAQLELRNIINTGKKGTLPSASNDYYIVVADENDPRAQRAAADVPGLIGNRLARFPSADLAVAERVATFATFVEVYAIEVSCDTARILRLRDRTLVGAGELDALVKFLPSRTTVSEGREDYRQIRILGQVAPEASLIAIPCLESEGQCFVESQGNVDRGTSE